jgi:ribosomal-protein-alanine N-acetyltransferase
VTVTIRAATAADAGELAALYAAQRVFLRPFEPDRGDAFYTPGGQRARLADFERRRTADAAYPFVIVDDGVAAGMAVLSNVVRGSFQSANLGYWVAQERNGRGVATAAIALVLHEAFGSLRLHRIEAGTLVDNTGSQRVLLKNRFRPIGLAHAYLRIAGTWRDHVLFAKTAEEDSPPPEAAADVTVSSEDSRLVARRRGMTVGSATLSPFTVEVAEEAQCSGVGSALVAAAAEHAGPTGLRASAALADAALLTFLQRHGFVAEGVVDGRVALTRQQ